MKTVNDVDMTAAQLAELWKVGVRSIQIYRAEAEKRYGECGRKQGKSYYFSPEDQQKMWAIREEGVNAQKVAQEYTQRNSVNFGETNTQCENSMMGGMTTITEQNDRQAMQIGQQLGQRFVGVMYASMMQEMAIGFNNIHQEMGEIQAGLAVSLPSLNPEALPGSEPTYQLPEGA